MSDEILSALERAVPGRVLRGADAHAYAKDDSPCVPVMPSAVVLAQCDNDVRETLRLASEMGVPVTPRSGGSGRVGGAVPSAGGVVLSTERMNDIEEIDVQNMRAVVRPGVVLKDFQDACEAQGLFYPPDPNSRTWCMLGGNVATNAAGPRAFRYGATRSYVTGMEASMMGGRNLTLGSRVRKSVTGYDMTGLMVGSEGTLGVVTRIFLKLLPKPELRATLCVYAESNHSALHAATVAAAWHSQPECVEFIDERSLSCMHDAGVAVPHGACALLVIDVCSALTLNDLGDKLAGLPGVCAVESGVSEAERDRIWQARSDLSFATRKLAAGKFSEDVCVPPSRLPLLLDGVSRLGDKHRVDCLSYGHAGDGNMHVNFLWHDDDQQFRCENAVGDLMQLSLELGGTLSGEHGIGLTKQRFLPWEQNAELIALQLQLKAAFDPQGLMNPGKVFSAPTHSGC